MSLEAQTTLTAVADTYLQSGQANQNNGRATFIRIRENGDNRALVRFDQAAIVAAVGSANLFSAKLRLNISTNGNGWGTDGGVVGVHRLKVTWTETGATWNCPNDTNTTNSAPNCNPTWNMDEYPNWPFQQDPTSLVLVKNNQTGTVEWDVTADVAAFVSGTSQNFGWVVRKMDEALSGRVDFSSREGASAPRLIITTGPPAPPSPIISAVEDTYIRSGAVNSNQGYEPRLRIQDSGNNRALVRMNQAAIRDFVGSGTLLTARLRLYIVENGDNWGANGRSVGVHRITRAWTEAGATWNCAVDTNPQNNAKNCSTDWDMTQTSRWPFTAAATASVIQRNGQTGWVEWDVKSDVAAFLAGTATNYGWLVRKADEQQNGRVEYSAREGSFKPELVLTVSTGLQITDFNPKSGPAGTLVTVTGAGLAPPSGSVLVKMTKADGGTIDAPVTTSTSTSLNFIVPPGSATGPFLITIDAATATSALPFTIQTSSDYNVTVSPSDASLIRGQSVSVAVKLASSTGFANLATLAISGVPVGVVTSFKPQQIAVGQTSILTLTSPTTQALGSSVLAVTANSSVDGSALIRSTSLTLNISPITTSFVGRTVIDDALETPIAGVSVRMLGTDGNAGITSCTGSTVSDAAGNFMLSNLAANCVGVQLIGFDGQSATSPPGRYSGVNLQFTLTAGQVTASPVLVHLPRIDDKEVVNVRQNFASDQTLSFSSIPGLSLTVYAGTILTMPNGTQPDPFPISAAKVLPDRLPDSKPPVPTMLGAFYVSFQPATSRASRPIAVYYPNTLNTVPGTNMVLMTLDPTRGRMLPYGTGTVSTDGTSIVPDLDPTNPGKRYGLSNLDWHAPMPPPPPTVNPPSTSGGTGRGTGGTCGCGGASAQAGDPVDLSTGLYVSNDTDLALGGPRGAVAIERIFRTLSGVLGPFGFGTQHAYNHQLETTPASQGQAITLANPDGSRLLFSLQPNGTFINTTAPNLLGAVMTSTVDGVVLRYKDGHAMKFQLAGAVMRESELSDPNGNTITILRNPAIPQQITTLIDPVGRRLLFTYDGSNRITSILDPIGRTVTYTYTGSGFLETVTDPEGGVTRYVYDPQNRLTQKIDARGVTVFTNVYDVNGRVVQQTQADGGIITFAYTLLNPLSSTSPVLTTTVTDALSRSTTYRFNPEGFVVQVTDPLGQTKILEREPGTNLLLAATGNAVCPICGPPESGDVHYTYDVNGNVLTSTNALGGVTRYTYDPVSNQVASIRDALGNLTQFVYDSASNLTRITDANGRATSFTYDSHGQLIEVRDPLNQRTAFGYDAFGNLTSLTDALGKSTTFLWDGISRSIGVKDALSRISRVTYDRLNRVLTQTDPAGGVTAFAYDRVGNMLSLTDAKNSRTAFAYDNKGRVTTRTTQQGRVDTRIYDLNDNLIRFADRRGQVSTFDYDALDRLTQETYQDATVTRTYDSNGRLTFVNDTAGGVFLYEYDQAGRLNFSAGPTGSVLYSRDGLGRVTQRTVAGLSPVTYAYDPVGNLLSASMPQASVTNTYDLRNQLVTMSRSNGVSSTYTRDPLGRILSLVHARGATTLDTHSYSYDDVGNPVRKTADTGQPLITEGALSTVDSENRLLTRGNIAYTHDTNGNRLTETGPSGTTTYVWDSRGRLASRTLGGQTTSLQYDHAGVMIRRLEATTNTTFVIDDVLNLASIVDNSGQSISLLTGRSMDVQYAAARSNQVEFILSDVLNSTIISTDTAGSTIGQVYYEPFGVSTPTASPGVFQFTGRTEIANDLFDYRSRVYDAVAGRFLSEDGAGFAGGTNLYRYAANAPTVRTDPTGNSPAVAVILAGGVVGGVAKAWEEAQYENATTADVVAAFGVGFVTGSVSTLGIGWAIAANVFGQGYDYLNAQATGRRSNFSVASVIAAGVTAKLEVGSGLIRTVGPIPNSVYSKAGKNTIRVLGQAGIDEVYERVIGLGLEVDFALFQRALAGCRLGKRR